MSNRIIPPQLHGSNPLQVQAALRRANSSPDVRAMVAEVLDPMIVHLLTECGEAQNSAEQPDYLDRARGAYQALADLKSQISEAR
jgi:hypothetical protein